MSVGAILVTGGAGYIGSHVALKLRQRSAPVLVLDDLSTGRRESLPPGVELVVGDVGDAVLLDRILGEHRVRAVLHLAAAADVAASVARPLTCYRSNVRTSLVLLEACVAHGLDAFVFSSTAAVYGDQGCGPVLEEALPRPLNPSGHSKLMVEQIACEAALSSHPEIAVFGTDYPTPDGTCIRDFIHVSDLADVHVSALDHLLAGGPSRVLNCGSGRGFSVREALETVARVSGRTLDIKPAPRRPGDAVRVVADTTRIRRELGWRTRYDLEQIVRTALAFEARGRQRMVRQG